MNILGAAYLISYSADLDNKSPLPTGPHTLQPTVQITQGDNVSLILTAVDGNGIPVDLTGATFVSTMSAPLGEYVQIPTDQHVANPDQVNFKGQFTLTLTIDNTMAISAGLHKELLTSITSGGATVYFRGFNLMNVYSAVPFA